MGSTLRPQCLSLLSSSSLCSLKSSYSDPALHSPGAYPALRSPGTPVPNREDFREVDSGVYVVMFDFDGTLTSTPGDRAARPQKQAELRQRAAMLEPQLRALREAGATLGIISKSTEGTIRDALQAAGLSYHFQGPVVGKAVSFEGKAGILEEMAQKGAFPALEPRLLAERDSLRRVLLVDDDIMELERARAAGLQTYAAPPKGGLRQEDFEAILAAVESEAPPRRQVVTAPSPGRHGGRLGWSSPQPASPAGTRPRRTISDLSCCISASGKWRNLILFSGECFEG